MARIDGIIEVIPTVIEAMMMGLIVQCKKRTMDENPSISGN
jgi:hypothetical protein